jgi:hypothetical protein
MSKAMRKPVVKKPLVWWMVLVALLVLVVVALVVGRDALAVRQASPVKRQISTFSLTFEMVPATPVILACLPGAKGTVTIKKWGTRDELTLQVVGLARNTSYALFVLQTPGAPFGMARYQGDLETDRDGEGITSIWGAFNAQALSITPTPLASQDQEGKDQTGAATGAVTLYHLGLWFGNPEVPFQQGCEPAQEAPIVTALKSERHVGIQVLNTSNFQMEYGPLSNVPA